MTFDLEKLELLTAAAILGVGQDVIGKFVRAKLLTPLYVNSDQRQFWLSEVDTLLITIPYLFSLHTFSIVNT